MGGQGFGQQPVKISVEDAARITIRLMNEPKATGQIFNIGSPQMNIGILPLALKVKEILGSDSEIVLQPYDHVYGPGYDDVVNRTPSMQKVRDTVAFDLDSDLDKIIKKTADYIRFYRSKK